KCVKVSRDIYYLKGKIEKAREKLSQTLMRYPTDKQLSDFLSIPEEIIAEALNSSGTPKYLDDYAGDTNILMHEILTSKSVDIDDLIYLKTELENLEEPERTIMIKRYYEDMTQKEIATSLGLTQVDVSRRQNKVLKKIKQT
ncbi:MAG: sigma-70 family RNA polymerase sigma factor, partial [Bacilli bacterium]|nr:sigma-70 family RNA polymerase sigma factor [Bacilli bacterium]